MTVQGPFLPELQECRFFEAAQFPAVNTLDRHVAQGLHRMDPDLQMTCYLRFIEIRRHAGQFQLSVQGFVRDTQKRAIGHTEAETIRRDRGAFHVQRNCA